MNKYLLAVIIGAFFSVISWGQWNKIRADKYRGELARKEAQTLVLEEKAHEADLLKETNEELAKRIKAMTPRKAKDGPVTGGVSEEANGVSGAVALSKGQPAPFEGVLADKGWIAKSLACLDYKDKWEKTLGDTILREKKLEDSVATLRSSRNFWRNSAIVLGVAGGAYIYFRK